MKNTYTLSCSWVTLLTTLTFVTLKLLGVIGWPWIWVVSPLWISFGIFCTLVVFVVFCALLGAVFLGGHRSTITITRKNMGN